MPDNNQLSAKRPSRAWRVVQIVLHVLGQICLWALVAAGTVAVIAVIAGSIFMNQFSDYLKTDVIPKAEDYAASLELDNISLDQTSFIYYLDPTTGEAKELQQLYATQNRVWVSYDEIPQDLVNAAIAIEDKRFREHDGVDWLRTVSAVRNFVGGDSSFGASTITQQLIKNLSKEDSVTVNRKVQEIFRALAVEKRYTKEEIMEWYLNTIYLGQGCYGVQSAAQVYFGKDVSELSTAECACIVGITNNPSLYDPYYFPNNNRKRQTTILEEMYKQGYIKTEADLAAAEGEEMLFHNGRYDEKEYTCGSCGFTGPRSAYVHEENAYLCPECGVQNFSVDDSEGYSYFVDTVYRDVVEDFQEAFDLSAQAAERKLLTGGYRIYATINPDIQNLVDRVYGDVNNVPGTVSAQQMQSAIAIVDNATGDLIAIRGGVGEKNGSLTYNRAEAALPTGSAIKPVSVYAPALDAGVVTPATSLSDSPLFDNWPQNNSRYYSGQCLVLRGLTSSLNTISVKTLDRLGLENSYNFMTQKLGFTTLVDSVTIGGQEYSDIAYAPLALGELTYGLTVREMTQAYATFPNNGVFREARSYSRVEDSEGNVVLDNTQETHTAIGAKAAYYTNYMLRSTVNYGLASGAYMSGMDVAGKTGTSGNNQTRWFAGYTPYYTAVVWCGYDEPEQIILSSTWQNPAITMWNQVMKPLHESLEGATFYQPDGVGYYSICDDCGKLATEACEKDIRDGSDRVSSVNLFYEDAPTEKCTCHVLVDICGASGKYATDACREAAGNTISQVGLIVKDNNFEMQPDSEYIYDPTDSNMCHVHSGEPTEPTDPTDEPDPTEPTTEPPEHAALPPTEAEWLRRLRLGL